MNALHCIWDFDGTLFDTYPHTCAVFAEILRRRGVTPDPAAVYAKMKISVLAAFAWVHADAAFVREFYELENTLSFEPVGRPFPGVPELLRKIAARGGRNYLYTHRDRVAYEYLEMYGLSDLFTGGVTAEDGFPHKPAPDALNHLIAAYGMDPRGAVMFGDRLIDIEAGKNAGVRTCLFDPDRALPPEAADWFCADVPAVTALVETLLPF